MSSSVMPARNTSMLESSDGARPAVASSSASTTSPMPKPSAGKVHAAQRLEQAVVAAAAADGAKGAAGVEQLEHRAGVVGEARGRW